MNTLEKKVFAIVVTFNPDTPQLSASLRKLRGAVHWTVVVDNGSTCDVSTIISLSGNDSVDLVALDQNIGLGGGQNIGIETAIQQGADCILLLDQDSAITHNMVELLCQGLAYAQSMGDRPTVAVGPSCQDRHGRRSHFARVQSGRLKKSHSKHAPTSQPELIETDFLMASGTLIDVSALRMVGGMRAEYFIDHVDREWCFRAIAAGYRLYGVPAAVLEHEVGLPQVVSFMGLTLRYSAQSPVRSYYVFRNLFLMSRDTQIPWQWQAFFIFRLLRYAVGSLVLMSHRLTRLRFMVRGFADGILGVRGRHDTKSQQFSDPPDFTQLNQHSQ